MVPAIFDKWAVELAVDAEEGEHVLNIACGTGSVSRHAVNNVGEQGLVVGVDLDPYMLKITRKMVKDNFECQEADATNLPFDDNHFDMVVCQQGLQFIPDRQTAVNELTRVLKPAGQAIIAVWCSTKTSPGFMALEGSMRQMLDDPELQLPPFSFDDPIGLIELAHNAGLARIAVSYRTRLSHFESVDVFVRSVAAGAPGMLGRLAELEGDAMTELVQRVETQLVNYIDDEGLVFPQASRVLYATKQVLSI